MRAHLDNNSFQCLGATIVALQCAQWDDAAHPRLRARVCVSLSVNWWERKSKGPVSEAEETSAGG